MIRQSAYSEKLKDPRWQKKRLEILQRDDWRCQFCDNEKEMLQVHHLRYFKDAEPWDYDNRYLLTLCESCHKAESANRKMVENTLLLILRERKYSFEDLIKIGKGFLAKKSDTPEIIAATVNRLLTDNNVYDKVSRLTAFAEDDESQTSKGECIYSDKQTDNGCIPAHGLSVIRESWKDFTLTCEQWRLLYSALEGSFPGEIHGRILRIFFPTEPASRLAERNGALIQEKLFDFYKIPLEIECVIGATPRLEYKEID